jgi:hypothetical protein
MQNLTTIRHYYNYFNAHLALNKLKSEGIQSFLQDEYVVTIDPFLSNAIGGIKLNVFSADAALALIILDTAEI